MTFDPTTNRAPWFLLTDEERTALEEWPHGWEFMESRKWHTTPFPSWCSHAIYRGKPAPAVTSTWQNIYPSYATYSQYTSRAKADECADTDRIAVVRIDTINGVTTAHLEDV